MEKEKKSWRVLRLKDIVENATTTNLRKSNVWRITTDYIDYNTGNIYRTGGIFESPDIYEELIHQAETVERDGNGVIEQRIIKMRKEAIYGK